MPDTPVTNHTLETPSLPLSLAGQLVQSASAKLGGLVSRAYESLGEVTVEPPGATLIELGLALRDTPGLEFDTLIDLCGLDYMGFKDGRYEGPRFAVVIHLLSVVRNQRIRLKVFCTDDDLPQVPSLVSVWPAAGWYEREAFDLYGIVFAAQHGIKLPEDVLVPPSFASLFPHDFKGDLGRQAFAIRACGCERIVDIDNGHDSCE